MTSIRRNCQGRFLRIVPTRLALQADSVVRTSRPPMLERLARSSGCAREPADTGGWTVLTWRAEGILAIRDSTLVQVPVDTSGKAAGAPVTLRGSTTPLWPGQADLLGHSLERWVRVTPFGLISYRLGAPDRSILVRAPGLPVGEPHPGTLAWSPNDTRLGLWIGNRVVVLQWPKPQ